MTDTRTDEVYQLGAWMGRKQAFASLAGRCSAADAECLRQIREDKRYRALNLNWEQFCKQYVGVSYMTVDRIIRRLEEFGPAYFLLTQATRITDNEYRRIHASVQGQNLLCAGEEIPITAENAPKLAAAVQALKQQALLPAIADAKDGSAIANAEDGSAELNTNAEPSRGAISPPADGVAGGSAGADPSVARQRAAVAREMQRAARDARAGLERYKRLAARRLEAHTRAALVAALHSLAGSAQDLCVDARQG